MGAEYANHAGNTGTGTLIALAPGLRETGWAAFQGPAVAASGVVGLKSRRKMDPSDRIAHQMDALTAIADRWQAACAVRIKADGVNWRLPGVEQLDEALRSWAEGLGIPLLGHTTREVRAAVAGRSNASRDAVCYAIMQRLGLIGQNRATAEWEAIAAGYYHSALRQGK